MAEAYGVFLIYATLCAIIFGIPNSETQKSGTQKYYGDYDTIVTITITPAKDDKKATK